MGGEQVPDPVGQSVPETGTGRGPSLVRDEPGLPRSGFRPNRGDIAWRAGEFGDALAQEPEPVQLVAADTGTREPPGRLPPAGEQPAQRGDEGDPGGGGVHRGERAHITAARGPHQPLHLHGAGIPHVPAGHETDDGPPLEHLRFGTHQRPHGRRRSQVPDGVGEDDQVRVVVLGHRRPGSDAGRPLGVDRGGEDTEEAAYGPGKEKASRGLTSTLRTPQPAFSSGPVTAHTT
jgi:hypothetical protein